MDQMLALIRSSEDYRARAEQLHLLFLKISDPFAAARLRGLRSMNIQNIQHCRSAQRTVSHRGVCSGR